MVENTVIHSFQKNAAEEIRISLTSYKGHDLIDVRVYYLVDGPDEEWKPTPKGICMKREHTEKLLEGLKLACEKDKKSDYKSKDLKKAHA